MKRIIPILLAVFSAAAVAKEPATTRPLSGTRYGVRAISVSSTAYSPDFNELMNFVNKRAAELGPKFLNVSAEKMDMPAFGIINSNIGGRGFDMEIELNSQSLPDARPAAKEFLNAMVESVVTFVHDDFDRRKDKELALAQRDLNICSQQLEQATKEAQQVRTMLRDVAGRADVSPQGITAAVSRLEEEKEKLELDLLGKKARREALEKEIAEQAALMDKQVQSDPVAKELKTIVEVREAKLENLKKLVTSGQASNGELNDAIASVAEARAKLAERQRDGGTGANGAGPDTLQSLNRERVTLSVDLHELEARLGFVAKRLPPLRSTMDKLDDLQRAEGDLKNARAALEVSTNHYRDLSRKLEAADPPQVLVRNMRDSADPLPATPGR